MAVLSDCEAKAAAFYFEIVDDPAGWVEFITEQELEALRAAAEKVSGHRLPRSLRGMWRAH
jgi:hypothetical protein